MDDTVSYCEATQISQPLPCNIVAKSRPLVNKITSFKKSTCSLTTIDSISYSNEYKNRVLTHLCKNSHKGLQNSSHAHQLRSPLVEVHTNNSAKESSQLCTKPLGKSENNNNLSTIKSPKITNKTKNKIHSKENTLKIKPDTSCSKKENADVSKTVVSGKTFCQSSKTNLSSATTKCKLSLNENQTSTLFGGQNKIFVPIKHKEDNGECLVISGKYSYDNKHNSSQPLSPILTRPNRKLLFKTPISGKGVNLKNSSPIIDYDCALKTNIIVPEKKILSETLVKETRGNETSDEPQCSPVLGSMRVQKNTETLVSDEMDCILPVLNKMHGQYSVQPVQQSVKLQRRRPNILLSQNKDLLIQTHYEDKVPSTNLCLSAIKQRSPKKSGMGLVNYGKNCTQNPISPTVCSFDIAKKNLFLNTKCETKKHQQPKKEQLSPVLDLSQYRQSSRLYNKNVKLKKSLTQQNKYLSSKNLKNKTNYAVIKSSIRKSYADNPTNKKIKNVTKSKCFSVIQNMQDKSLTSNKTKKNKKQFCLKTSGKPKYPHGNTNLETPLISPVLGSSQYKTRLAASLKKSPTVRFSSYDMQRLTSKSSVSLNQCPNVKAFPKLLTSSPGFNKKQNSMTTPNKISNSSNFICNKYFPKVTHEFNLEKSTNEPLDQSFGLESIEYVIQDVFFGCPISSATSFDNHELIKSFSSNTSLEQEDGVLTAPTFNTEYDIRNFPLALSQKCDELMAPFKEEHLTLQSFETLSNSSNDSCFSLSSSVKSSVSDKSGHTNGNNETTHGPSQDKLRYSQISSDLLKVVRKKDLSLKPRPNKYLRACKTSLFCQDFRTDDKATNSNVRKYVQSSPQKIYLKKNHNMNGTMKKDLSLYHNNQSLSDNTSPETDLRSISKGTSLVDNEEDNDDMVFSGVERFPEHTSDKSVIEKFPDIKMREERQTTHYKSNLPATLNINTSQGNQSTRSLEENKSISKTRIIWKSSDEFFGTQPKTNIEEFDEESPNSKNDSYSSTSNLEITQSQLTQRVEQYTVSPAVLKPCRSGIKNLSLDFDSCFEVLNMCENQSSEEPGIQESSQESVWSTLIQIESSNSSSTKSTEISENNRCSGRLSFPPALKATEKQPHVEAVLDSACKPRRKRMKRDSLVERMRRLVRAERAEVNMFRHEGARSVARACSLLVESVVNTCSRVVLICRYADAGLAYSQPFSAGEEVVDPDACVFVDPNYAKHMKSGSTILIYPPWHSVWLDGRGVVMMYGVTKVQLISNFTGANQPSSSLKTRLEQKFHCEDQEEECGCQRELMKNLWNEVDSSSEHSWASASIMSALRRGRYPHNIRLRLSIVHRFWYRHSTNQVLPSMICVDGNGDCCQLNLRSVNDKTKLDNVLKNSQSRTLVLHKLTICKRLNIDKSIGLRSMLSQLHHHSATQHLMYVVTPSSDQWSAQLAAPSTASLQSAEPHLLSAHQESEGRLSATVQVVAEGRGQLYVWDKQQDSYFKIKIMSSATLPSFSSRSSLHIRFLWKHEGDLTIDKYSMVTVVETDKENSPSAVIPRLSLDSVAGDLVLLDSVVIRVNSDVYLRWVGVCGHNLLKLQSTGLFYCATCTQTVSTCEQKLALEVCVDVSDVSAPIRVKVKNETAKVLMLGSEGLVSSEKSYNLIGVIGTSLKGMTVVLEVLKNPFGDILEFLLEEL